MSFTIFYIEKTPLQPIKTRSSKSRNIDIFPKGLTHGFGLKLAVFATFIFQAIQARKMSFYDILEHKNALLGHKNKKFKKSKNLHFFRGVNPQFWSKIGQFSKFFFQAIQAKKMSFYDILEQKNALLGHKNKKFKKSKNLHFF